MATRLTQESDARYTLVSFGFAPLRSAHARAGGTATAVRDNASVTFAVLYVCTGNVCRSPIAELLFRAWVAPGADVTVSSAGTEALVGHGIDGSSASALGQLGIDPSRHRARQFEPWMAAEADLVLTAERAHRDLVITELPGSFRRVFTMKEFARLARHARPGPPDEVIGHLAALRGIDGAVDLDTDNMPDPYRSPIHEAKSIAQQVTNTVHATIDALGMWAQGHAVATPVLQATAPARRPRPHRS
jgi:protein-tyrosine-phosphatase